MLRGGCLDEGRATSQIASEEWTTWGILTPALSGQADLLSVSSGSHAWEDDSGLGGWRWSSDTSGWSLPGDKGWGGWTLLPSRRYEDIGALPTSSRSTGGRARSTGGDTGLGSRSPVASARWTWSVSALIFSTSSGVRSTTSPAGPGEKVGGISSPASITAMGRPREASASWTATGLPSAASPSEALAQAAVDLEAERVFGFWDDAMVSSSQGWSMNCKGIPLLTPIVTDQTFWLRVELTRELLA